ncbi:MAG: hypothetical protein ACOVN2_12630, partial [Usitatibacteraceae bacterium]
WQHDGGQYQGHRRCRHCHGQQRQLPRDHPDQDHAPWPAQGSHAAGRYRISATGMGPRPYAHPAGAG